MQSSEEGTPQGGPLSPLLANIYLDALDRELEQRGLAFSRYADDCNIYVSSRRAAERVLASITDWIKKHLRLEVNATKSGTGRPWERKFLGFRINPQGKIEAAPQSVERFKMKVRELWRSCQSQSSDELRDTWRAYVRGWWGYYRLAEERRNVLGLEGWIRRHIRSCFWQRWHDWRGRVAGRLFAGTNGEALPQFAANAKVRAVKPGAETLAVSGVGTPEVLLARQQFGNGFAAALTTDLLWRWKLSLPSSSHAVEKFWQQLLLSLAPASGEGLRVVKLTPSPAVNAPALFSANAESCAGV